MKNEKVSYNLTKSFIKILINSHLEGTSIPIIRMDEIRKKLSPEFILKSFIELFSADTTLDLFSIHKQTDIINIFEPFIIEYHEIMKIYNDRISNQNIQKTLEDFKNFYLNLSNILIITEDDRNKDFSVSKKINEIIKKKQLTSLKETPLSDERKEFFKKNLIENYERYHNLDFFKRFPNSESEVESPHLFTLKLDKRMFIDNEPYAPDVLISDIANILRDSQRSQLINIFLSFINNNIDKISVKNKRALKRFVTNNQEKLIISNIMDSYFIMDNNFEDFNFDYDTSKLFDHHFLDFFSSHFSHINMENILKYMPHSGRVFIVPMDFFIKITIEKPKPKQNTIEPADFTYQIDFDNPIHNGMNNSIEFDSSFYSNYTLNINPRYIENPNLINVFNYVSKYEE